MPLIDAGHRAPTFQLPDQYGAKHDLREYQGRPVVLYFYPKDDTSGCTREACEFRERWPQFQAARAMVFGISPDDVASHARFAQKHGLEFPLLADVPDDSGLPQTCDQYGVWQEKSMYGRRYMGVVRTTYLIGPDGEVVRRWDNVKVPGHAAEVQSAASEL